MRGFLNIRLLRFWCWHLLSMRDCSRNWNERVSASWRSRRRNERGVSVIERDMYAVHIAINIVSNLIEHNSVGGGHRRLETEEATRLCPSVVEALFSEGLAFGDRDSNIALGVEYMHLGDDRRRASNHFVRS